jgi:hypothetical protein
MEERRMTGKADFGDEQWHAVLQAPPAAGLLVATSQRGGTFRESFSIAHAYTDARKEHGGSALLDEIVSIKPELNRPHAHSVDEVKQQLLAQIEAGITAVAERATSEEAEAYKGFILSLAQRVAEAHREGFLGFSGDRVSDAERAAVAEVAEAVGLPAPA